jgi:hypothetical protein
LLFLKENNQIIDVEGGGRPGVKFRLVDANGHRSFVRVESDVRRGFLCNPRLIVRRFLVEA